MKRAFFALVELRQRQTMGRDDYDSFDKIPSQGKSFRLPHSKSFPANETQAENMVFIFPVLH